MIDWERGRWGVKFCDRWGNLKNNETQIHTETNSHRCTQTDTHDVSTSHDTWRNGSEEAGRKKKKDNNNKRRFSNVFKHHCQTKDL